MARNEDEPQKVVADVVVERSLEVRRGLLQCQQLAADLFILPSRAFPVTEMVDGAMLGGGHKPGSGVGGDSRRRPLFQGSQQRFLGEVLGETHVANNARESRDDFGGLHSPDRINGAMAIGSRHTTDHIMPGAAPAIAPTVWPAARASALLARALRRS